MAGNFWQSSHCKQWLLEPHEIKNEFVEKDKKIVGGEDQYRKLMILFANVIQSIGEQLKLRQQVIATATVFFRRFYIRNCLSSCDPLLMAPTCLFLAAKVEEHGAISQNRLINAATQIVRNKYRDVFLTINDYPYRGANILECEFYLLELMDCCLIVFHPYRPLLQFLSDLGITKTDDDLSLMAWRILNDSYRSDVMLQYPPYMIALTALHMAACQLELINVSSKSCMTEWFAELSVDLKQILTITKEILKLYEVWGTYKEDRTLHTILDTVPKAKPDVVNTTQQSGQNSSSQPSIN